MGSSRGNCEIVEAKDEPSTTSRPDRDQRPPIVKKSPNYKSLEDDINKLFESVNLRASKSLDLSDSWRKASKRPMRGVGSHSSAIGFSQPVSLKQSLRGLCISQAAEMAAMKRLSVPSSPRISEAGKITNLYRSVVVESSGSGGAITESSYSSPCINATPSIKSTQSLKQSANTCPHFPVSLNIKDAESSLAHKDIVPLSEVDTQVVETIHDNAFDSVLKPKERVSGLKKAVIEDSASRSNKAVFKLRRKSRPTIPSSSCTAKSNKETKSAKITSHTVKPVIRSKPVVIKKSKKVAVSVSTGGNVKVSPEVNNSHLFCQRCQCSLKDSDKDHYVNTLADVASNTVPSPTIKIKTDSKSSEKGDITQSSKSSDFSSSTTSLSEESNLSGLIFGNRPHMSKDMRWRAVDCIRKQYGFLGLSHFNLLKKLGSGDIGTVYLAELIGTNCVFAIKVMDNEFLGRRKKLPRAQTEREILRMLDHPFLPTLYSQFTTDNLSCLVMEFCPGGDLHVLRQKQPDRYFPEQAARFYVAEVLLALEYLHMLGIVYRDLKPENILVREDGHIMLTDFDLSLRCSVNPILVKSSSLGGVEPPRISGPCVGSNCIDPFCTGPSCKLSSCFSPRLFPVSTRARKLKADVAARARSLPQLVAEPTEARSNSFVGTHEYLAPEIIKGEGHGSAVDWWTFGVFLYELLYGKTPFKGANNDETLDNVVLQNNLRFPDFPIVSFHARDLIRGLLVKEPENRLGTEMGAAEIKRHPFFDGLNWALIRCASPPEVPESHDVGKLGNKFMDCSVDGEHLEFELF